MANPRAIVDYEGIQNYRFTVPYDNSAITYSATADGGSTSVGLAVSLTSSDTLTLVGDAENVLGKLISVEADGMCTVERGFVTLPGGSGATLTRGKSIVGDLGAASAEGYIREVNTAVAAELGVMDGKIIDPSTTTAVVVHLP